MARIKKILVIAHFPFENIRVREKEIAIHLSKYYNTFYLLWRVPYPNKLSARIWANICDLLQVPKNSCQHDLKIVQIPVLHRPYRVAKFFNEKTLGWLLRKEKFDLIINASYFFPVLKGEWKYFFDLIDLPTEDWGSSWGSYIDEYCRKEIEKADKVLMVSNSLGDIISKRYNCKTYWLPNGTDISKFRNVQSEQVDLLRKKLGLDGKVIFGAVGNWGDWMNLPFLLDVFLEVKKQIKNSALLIVGPGEAALRFKNKIKDSSIIFTGSVPHEDIEKYFSILDVAILPNIKRLWQDVAFHIKLIEYTAARKIVVSAPLEEVLRLNLPNVITTDQKVREWVETLVKAKETKWEPEWDILVERFDWSNIIQRLIHLIEES